MENKYRILTFLPKEHFYNLGLKIEQRNQYKPFFQSSKSHSRRKVLSFWNSKIKSVFELPKNFWKMTKHSTFLRLSVPPSINCFSAFLLVLSNLFQRSMIQCSTAAGKKIPSFVVMWWNNLSIQKHWLAYLHWDREMLSSHVKCTHCTPNKVYSEEHKDPQFQTNWTWYRSSSILDRIKW